ncbi:MAG TPA: biopolymer transporter ExbD [Pyrinomonadaceae bacterium]|nr:biopolymer transporter ExbD [Pyrinomonadaceae bacterium]
MSAEKRTKRAVPFINVTPLIDVLLVLLIIFMVVSPLKPSVFKAQLPEPPKQNNTDKPDIHNLVVTIKEDGALELNKIGGMGSVNDTGKLSAELSRIFQERIRNQAFSFDMLDRNDLPDEARIQKTVFIKAPKSIAYGEVAKVIDSIRGAGAKPIGLQLDELD